MIDQALAEPDQARRAALWAKTDRRIMRDAPSSRSSGRPTRSCGPRGPWLVYDPWTTMPDLTAPWLDPPL